MERWEKAKQLYQEALGKDPAERAAFVEQGCGGEEELLREVQSLLAYEEAAQHFMEQPAVVAAATSLNADSASGSFVGRTLNQYEIVSLLGAGGMGEVYLALDRRLDRHIALKILPADATQEPDRMDRFIREARAASAINHPNVATIYDIGESEGVHFIAMEYVQGRTLAETIHQHADTAVIVDVAVQVADALEAAHDKGIVHRDIKPANLMLTPRGQVKVLDFGIAKRAGSDSAVQGDATTGITMPGLVVGSVHYMSPEQVLGRAIDHRSDIFSLGVVLYKMATGQLPFEGRTPTETMDRILHADPQPAADFNPRIPPGLERIIRRCLEKEVAGRYPSARDLMTDLHRVSRGEFPSGLAVAERRHNLPVQLTTFIGRNQEITDIQRLLSTTRLLTLTGAGGCGKTRLALQAAADVLDQYQDGVWLVDLAPLSEPNLVVQSAASVLKLQEGPNRTLQQVLSEFVRHRHLLLVLDNCEHLIAACAQLAETLLQVSTNLRILATSREALAVPGETLWRVPSLSLPAPGQTLAAGELLHYEAIRLFEERASAVAPAFKIVPGNVASVAEICHRLDGIPLAIELAAARLKVLSIEQINARLKDRFRLLTGGSRTAMARQRTLEATVDWSYELLTETERQLMCRLSVFAGGWTIEAAEDVCSGNGIEKEETLDLLSHLVDKSLVNVDERSECKPDRAHPSIDEDTAGNRRYRFLETVRQYARERLLRSGDAEWMRDRHYAFFFELAQRAEPELTRADQVAWLNRLEAEHDNLRCALDWSLATPENGDKALKLASALWWFWTKRGWFGEGQQWLERALAGTAQYSQSLRAWALVGLSHMTFFNRDYTRTEIVTEQSLTLAGEAEHTRAAAFSLYMQALVAANRGDFERTAILVAKLEAAVIPTGDLWFQSLSVGMRALMALQDGDYQRAGELFEQCLLMYRQTGDKWVISIVLHDLAGLRILRKEYAEAKAAISEAILLCQDLADRRGTAWCLGLVAAAEAAQARFERAGRLWGAAEALLEGVGSTMPDVFFQLFHDQYLKITRGSLDESTFQAAWSEGRIMTLTQAVRYGLQMCE